ncbi:MAG: hypothetical protein D6746_06485 [Bacteroidetes bacterium]|nr:MAG: hypothetical protein D6746_06485 [Bacteroidota bacterium]
MDIRNTTPGLNGTTPLHPASPQETGKTAPGPLPPQPEQTPGTPPRDRFDLSGGTSGIGPDIAPTRAKIFARKALDALPPLSEERLEKIRRRMEEGFYSRPDVLKKVAHHVASDLLGDLDAKAAALDPDRGNIDR